MKVGPRYKIAKRLGAAVFDKTQTQKFALAESRSQKSAGRMPPKTDYGKQFLEKQRVRVSYGITEKQFKNYITEALASKAVKPAEALFQSLERRMDNIVYRLGLAKSRRGARQMVSHGHFLVDDVKVTIPSFKVSPSQIIKVREGSSGSALFTDLEEKLKDTRVPEWLTFDPKTKRGEVKALPTWKRTDFPFDLSAVLEFYSR